MIESILAAGSRSVHVVAPTGKAAKRAAESLQHTNTEEAIVPCTTIHRALSPTSNDESPEGVPSVDAKKGRGRGEFIFGRNKENPLDAQVVVVDETSMVDIELAASLLRAIKPGSRVIFVGDENQLPSVGPGSFLRDMIAAGIPTACLTEIVRSDGGGRVVRACHAMLAGETPDPAPTYRPPTENWTHIEINDLSAIADRIVELHDSVLRNGKRDPVWFMQVVTPQNGRIPVGCDNLNRLLSDLLNKRKRTDGGNLRQNDDPGYAPPFAVGDKVVRTKNGACEILHETSEGGPDRWEWGGHQYASRPGWVVNGDMGEVLDIVHEEKETHVVVSFNTPKRLCRLPHGECHLVQAYAMTAHKCQGSGFPYVIVPVHESYWWDTKTGTGLFSREWLYTAISRAELVLVTVGQMSAIRKAVGRKTVHMRKTRLAERILRGTREDRSCRLAKRLEETRECLFAPSRS